MRYGRKLAYLSPESTKSSRRLNRWLLLACGSAIVSGLILQGGSKTTDNPRPPTQTATQSTPVERIGLRLTPMQRSLLSQNQRLPFEPKVPTTTDESDLSIAESKSDASLSRLAIRPGDTLAGIFTRLGIEATELPKMLALPEVAKHLKTLKVGTEIRFAQRGSRLDRFEYEIDDFNTLLILRAGDTLSASVVTIKRDIRQAAASGHIARSLFVDLQRAGVPDATIMAFADLFGWDVDFVRDIKKGDRFKIIFEEVFREGKKVGNGRILAAEFINGEKTLRAFYFKSSDGTEGYYSQNGDAMKKAFLIAPLNFTKVSSRFNLARMHPVLNRIRAHKGVDYAAPMGTAVRAVANGRVDFAGKQSGYGNVIVLKHGERYTTLYGHLMKFASGISRGDTVKQGQLIGYVGMTGLATGPHLHYEFRIGGVHVDPLKVKLPKAIPLEKKYLASFRETAAPLFEQLTALDGKSDETQRSVVSKDSKKSPSASN